MTAGAGRVGIQCGGGGQRCVGRHSAPCPASHRLLSPQVSRLRPDALQWCEGVVGGKEGDEEGKGHNRKDKRETEREGERV